MTLTDTEKLKTQLSEAIFAILGLEINTKCIYDNSCPFYNYIPAKALHRFRPLILSNYCEENFLLIIPSEDFELMKTQSISINDYIQNSVWNYGYYSAHFGVYWYPLEGDCTLGIHNKEKIITYLNSLKCMCVPSKTMCHECSNSDNLGSLLYQPDKTTIEINDCKNFESELVKRINRFFNFDFAVVSAENCSKVQIYPTFDKGHITVHYPANIMIDLLYHPNKNNINSIIQSLDFELVIRKWFQSSIYPEDTNVCTIVCPITRDKPILYRNYLMMFPQFKKWFTFTERIEHCMTYIKNILF